MLMCKHAAVILDGDVVAHHIDLSFTSPKTELRGGSFIVIRLVLKSEHDSTLCRYPRAKTWSQEESVGGKLWGSTCKGLLLKVRFVGATRLLVVNC